MGRPRQPICPRCGNTPKAEGSPYCDLCWARYQRERRAAAPLTMCACGCGEGARAKYVLGHNNRGRTFPQRRVSDERKRALHAVSSRRYARANPEKVRALGRLNDRLRRACVSDNTEAREYAAILLRDPCVYCGGQGGTIDHIVPVSEGGSGDPVNLAGACGRCNRSKQAKPLLTYLLARAA